MCFRPRAPFDTRSELSTDDTSRAERTFCRTLHRTLHGTFFLSIFSPRPPYPTGRFARAFGSIAKWQSNEACSKSPCVVLLLLYTLIDLYPCRRQGTGSTAWPTKSSALTSLSMTVTDSNASSGIITCSYIERREERGGEARGLNVCMIWTPAQNEEGIIAVLFCP